MKKLYLPDKPQVRLVMSSPSPILEKDHRNVTLTCEVATGNPRFLDEVIWYLDGELLKQLPDCNQTQGEGMLDLVQQIFFSCFSFTFQ